MNSILEQFSSYIQNLNTQEKIFFIALAVNTIIAIAYLIVGLSIRKFSNKKAFLYFLIILLCPLIGLVIVLFSHLLFKATTRHAIDLEDISFRQDRVNTLLTPVVKDEINVVPIEEALAVADKSDLRGLVLNVLKNDMEMSLTAITKALNSSDSETSHYSASVLLSALSDFRNSVDNLSESLRKEPDNEENGLLLVNSLISVLQQNILSEFEQRSYINTLDWAAETVFEQNGGGILSAQQYHDIASLLISDGEYTKAETWCQRALEFWPDSVESWNINLRLYYTTQDRDNFFRLLNQLKQSSVVLDQQTLELVRVFS